jgi:uncharacterized membrane protein
MVEHVDHHRATRLERSVHLTLLSGAVVSGALMLAGLMIVLVAQEPRPQAVPPGVAQLVRMAVAGNGTSMIDLGLLLLLCTPLLRVAVLAVGWMLTGDRRFAAVALIVLSLLGLSLALGIG